MCIRVEETSQPGEWTGWKWKITDENKLALLIAHVAIGEAEVAELIIKQIDEDFDDPSGGYVGAKNILKFGKIEGKDDKLKNNSTGRNTRRDGWLFQVIAWIASHEIYKTEEIRLPHERPSDQGPDGIIVKIDVNGTAKIIICEEKASDDPGRKIIGDVWKEFRKFDSGCKDRELRSPAIQLLKNRFDGDFVMARKVVNDILGTNRKLAFRVSVTIDEKYDSDVDRKRLFKGYKYNVSCNYKDRYAETLKLDNLACDMERIAQLAVKEIEKWEENQNV